MTGAQVCSVEGCSGRHKAHGYCIKHYRRLQRGGHPLASTKAQSEVQKYYLNVVLNYEGEECLIWPFATVNGYGCMRRNGEKGNVSRFLCADVNGPPPTPKHEAAHSCGRGADGCVTRVHLSWKTRAENQADRLDHGTHNRGERQGASKITEQQAREILSLKGIEPQSSLAARYGISRSAVSDIHVGKNWSWLGA